MQSLVRKKSSGSVTVFWFDREKALELLAKNAQILGRQRAEVLRVGVFGSLANGRAVPGSDADLIIIVSKNTKRMIDRCDDYIGYFGGLGLGVDLFCYTEEEAWTIPLAKRACAGARWLFRKTNA